MTLEMRSDRGGKRVLTGKKVVGNGSVEYSSLVIILAGRREARDEVVSNEGFSDYRVSVCIIVPSSLPLRPPRPFQEPWPTAIPARLARALSLILMRRNDAPRLLQFTGLLATEQSSPSLSRRTSPINFSR